MYFLNFMSKYWLESDNSEMISGREWKVTILWEIRLHTLPIYGLQYLHMVYR